MIINKNFVNIKDKLHIISNFFNSIILKTSFIKLFDIIPK